MLETHPRTNSIVWIDWWIINSLKLNSPSCQHRNNVSSCFSPQNGQIRHIQSFELYLAMSMPTALSYSFWSMLFIQLLQLVCNIWMMKWSGNHNESPKHKLQNEHEKRHGYVDSGECRAWSTTSKGWIWQQWPTERANEVERLSDLCQRSRDENGCWVKVTRIFQPELDFVNQTFWNHH